MPPKPFKPPRPSTTAKKTPRSKSTTKKTPKSTTASKPLASGSTSFSRPSLSSTARASPSGSDDDPFASTAEDEDDEIQDVEMGVENEKRETIPPELLTRLLHESFKEKGTRISKDANAAVGRYMETFVREALARAAFMRADMDGGDGFLEVEDLEKLAPQLLLDF